MGLCRHSTRRSSVFELPEGYGEVPRKKPRERVQLEFTAQLSEVTLSRSHRNDRGGSGAGAFIPKARFSLDLNKGDNASESRMYGGVNVTLTQYHIVNALWEMWTQYGMAIVPHDAGANWKDRGRPKFRVTIEEVADDEA